MTAHRRSPQTYLPGAALHCCGSDMQAPPLHLFACELRWKQALQQGLRRAIRNDIVSGHTKPRGVQLPDLVAKPDAHSHYI
jgi:hypothetical protein